MARSEASCSTGLPSPAPKSAKPVKSSAASVLHSAAAASAAEEPEQQDAQGDDDDEGAEKKRRRTSLQATTETATTMIKQVQAAWSWQSHWDNQLRKRDFDSVFARLQRQGRAAFGAIRCGGGRDARTLNPKPLTLKPPHKTLRLI